MFGGKEGEDLASVLALQPGRGGVLPLTYSSFTTKRNKAIKCNSSNAQAQRQKAQPRKGSGGRALATQPCLQRLTCRGGAPIETLQQMSQLTSSSSSAFHALLSAMAAALFLALAQGKGFQIQLVRPPPC